MSKSLEARGFRFIYTNGLWSWAHPLLVGPRDVDCTAMTDEDFDRFVEEKTLPPPPKGASNEC
jgi:hypothetical protein